MPIHYCLPIFNAALQDKVEIDLGYGFYIKPIPNQYLEMLKENIEFSSGYRSKLNRLTVSIFFIPKRDHPLIDVHSPTTQNTCEFVAHVFRFATNIPIDFPFYFFEDGRGLGNGTTLVRNFGHQQGNYDFVINGGDYENAIENLKNNLELLVNLATEYISTRETNNRLIRGIEFIALVHKTQHIAARLINSVTFLEILFSSSGNEITHQLSSCVSWYLEKDNDERRLELYDKIREIYNARSSIVHGRDTPEGGFNAYRALCVEVEDINRQIFNRILENNHLDFFSWSQRRRKRELQKLCLGLSSYLKITQN